MSEISVRVEALDKRYERIAALSGVSFELSRGSIALVAGPNGAGKSTLLRVLGMLTRPSSGQVEILGGDPFASGGSSIRGQVGYLGAQSGLYGDLSIEENLQFGAQLHGLQSERVRKVVSDLGLVGWTQRKVRTLSLGYQRRAGLARTLLCEPELLLLDEPWNGLDAAASRKLVQVLDARREAGATTLVAAHAVTELSDLFDVRLSIEAGRLTSFETGLLET
ncbi:MAG: heme ABC exporter ATP-binding protein CcmA [bacterium]|nr:heme ABC exporter ATP-binding protein CcmA [bacterium]